MSEPTTRERRERALIAVNTGDGKGKTTAAMGLALRGWAQGWDVGVYQFIKSGKWRVGEEKALRALGEQTGTVTWEHMGTGWSWLRPSTHVASTTSATGRAAEVAAVEGWTHVKELLAAERHDLYILDEFTYLMDKSWVDVDEVVEVLAQRPGHQHVVITGRRCPQAILDIADLATEMVKIKHPFDSGSRGQAGIEW